MPSIVSSLLLIGDAAGLRRIYFCGGFDYQQVIADDWHESADFFATAVRELEEYFAGYRRKFTVKTNLQGTDFQCSVWQQLQKIPYGTTQSYKDIASALGKPGAARAVGMANNRNPLPILVPCHRVIFADGSLGGFASGVELKRKLLVLEAESLGEYPEGRLF